MTKILTGKPRPLGWGASLAIPLLFWTLMMANINLKNTTPSCHHSIIPNSRQAFNSQHIRYIFIAIVISTTFFAGCASTREATRKEILNLDKQHFKETTLVTHVLSGTVAEFSTLDGYRPQKYIGINWLDSFLKGYLNKKTGKRDYQVYQFISYQGRGWRSYHRVEYYAPEGDVSDPLTSYHQEIINCTSSFGCTYEEHVVFDMKEALLRKIAKLAATGRKQSDNKEKIPGFLYRLFSKSGHHNTYWLLPAEVAGLLEKMDEYDPK